MAWIYAKGSRTAYYSSLGAAGFPPGLRRMFRQEPTATLKLSQQYRVT